VRILIAEDDPIIGLALAKRVRTLGHEPIGPVSDGEQAIATAEATLPDLYLFDIEMPVLDGLAAASELTARGLRRPVVIVTGVKDPELIERAIGTGVGAYLTKPIVDRELEAAILLAATRHRELEALEAEVGRAQEALEDRKLVERAKALLMTALELPEPEAFRRMQLAARRRNLRLVEIARQVIEQRSVLEGDALKRKPAPPARPLPNAQ
jgi:AmiR/NasT family two-component response regulator